MHLTDDDFAAMRRILAAGPACRLAVLFGSGAKGALRPDSDVDIAWLPADETLPLGAELELAAALESAVGRAVDLVRIDEERTFLCWQIARTGRVLLATPAREWPRFQARAASSWYDFAPLMEQAARLYRRRLAAGTPR